LPSLPASELNGKEGVSGSSPEEGLIPADRHFLRTSEPFSFKDGTRGLVGERSEISLQIGTFSESTEHLPEKEGLEWWPRP